MAKKKMKASDITPDMLKRMSAADRRLVKKVAAGIETLSADEVRRRAFQILAQVSDLVRGDRNKTLRKALEISDM